MSRWPQRSWWRPSACCRRRRAEFCCRRLKAGAAERATRLAVRRGFHGHRGRPRGLQSWPGGGSRRPWPACGRQTSFLNVHDRMTHATRQDYFYPGTACTGPGTGTGAGTGPCSTCLPGPFSPHLVHTVAQPTESERPPRESIYLAGVGQRPSPLSAQTYFYIAQRLAGYTYDPIALRDTRSAMNLKRWSFGLVTVRSRLQSVPSEGALT